MAYDLQPLLARLAEMADDRYRAFNERLTPGAEGTSLGVRLPALRALAKEIARGDAAGFLDASRASGVHELYLLHAMVLARQPWPERLAGLKTFVPAIGNWAVCDVLCADLKPKPGELGELAAFLESCIATGEEFQVRFGYVARMLYYRGDDWIDETFRLFAAFRHEGYYARMGAAWGISMLFLCQRERTLHFLETDSLDRFTHNKAIQKAIESRRVTDEDRAVLRALRR